MESPGSDEEGRRNRASAVNQLPDSKHSVSSALLLTAFLAKSGLDFIQHEAVTRAT